MNFDQLLWLFPEIVLSSVPADCDIVGGVDGVCLTYTKEGRSTGEAFIELKTPDDYKNALAKDRKYMGHRYVEGKTLKSISKRSEVGFPV